MDNKNKIKIISEMLQQGFLTDTGMAFNQGVRAMESCLGCKNKEELINEVVKQLEDFSRRFKQI